MKEEEHEYFLCSWLPYREGEVTICRRKSLIHSIMNDQAFLSIDRIEQGIINLNYVILFSI